MMRRPDRRDRHRPRSTPAWSPTRSVDEATGSPAERAQSVLEVLLDSGVGRPHRRRPHRRRVGRPRVRRAGRLHRRHDRGRAAARRLRAPRRRAAAAWSRTASCVVAVGVRQAGNIELKDDLARLTEQPGAVRDRQPRRHRGQDQPGLPGRGRAARPHLTTSPPTRTSRGPRRLHRGLRRGAGRALREPADHPGDHRPRLRHPHRADRAGPAGALPHRRRAARTPTAPPRTSRTAWSPGSRSWPT